MIQNEQLHELALFAGAGGGILGGKLLGWKCVCAVEYEPAAQRMLAARQDDGCLEHFPIWDDVRTFDGKPWRGLVDVVSGGFPCQDISAAGKGAGLSGERSGLWSEMSRIIGEVRPRFALVENSPVLTSRGLGTVLGDLAAMGYDARWGVLGAVHAGAPHKRDRIWIVANAHSPSSKDQRMLNGSVGEGIPSINESERSGVLSCFRNGGADVANANGISGRARAGRQDGAEAGDDSDAVSDIRRERGQLSAERKLATIQQPRSDSEARSSGGIAGEWWATEPNVGRVAHGVAARVDRLRAIGNGQVPAVVRLAWNLLR